MSCLQVFSHSVSCPCVWGSLVDCVCSEPAMSHGVLSCRQEKSVEEAVFVTSPSCYSHGAFVHHSPHFNYNVACDNPFFSPRFCDVFQVAGEGHRYRSPEFCPPWESFRSSVQGQTLSDCLTFGLHGFAILSLSTDEGAITVCIRFSFSCSWNQFLYVLSTNRATIGIWSLRWVWAEAYSLRVFMMSLLDNFSFFFLQHWDNLSRLPGRWLWANCIQHSALIW